MNSATQQQQQKRRRLLFLLVVVVVGVLSISTSCLATLEANHAADEGGKPTYFGGDSAEDDNQGNPRDDQNEPPTLPAPQTGTSMAPCPGMRNTAYYFT
jgi:hypothetical protein